MPMFLKNLGLSFLAETEEDTKALFGYVINNGTPIKGYYESPYLNYHFGEAQMIVRTTWNDTHNGFIVEGLDTHARGRAFWDLRVHEMNINRSDADPMMRRIGVTKLDGHGLAIVNVVNADVLPSYMKNDVIELQMVGFPHFIHYYKTEEQYAENQPNMRNGKKFLLDEGFVFPSGLLSNRSPKTPESEKNDDLDDECIIRAKVKGLYQGLVQMEPDGQKYNNYVICVIDTEFGPLEILHTIDQVREEERDAMEIGATVVFQGVLSGDPAIFDYENGIVRDHAHDLSALRYVFAGHEPERIRSILSSDSEYIAEYNHVHFHGPDEIIARLKCVQADNTHRQFAQYATIVSVEEGEKELPYGVGTRCLVLSQDELDNYYAIAFVDVNEEGNIVRITTSTESRYRFQVDPEPDVKSSLEEQEPPESVNTPILARARFHGIIDDEITDEMACDYEANYALFLSKIKLMVEPMMEHADEEFDRLLKKAFGYLFAKAAELERVGAFDDQSNDREQIVIYQPEDAWNDKIASSLPEKEQLVLEDAMELGSQFYGDYSLYTALWSQEDQESECLNALFLVQNLGRLYGKRCFEKES